MSARGGEARLSAEASGLRHLRWAREVLASLEAHAAHNPRLSAAEREAVRAEADALREAVDALSGAVKPYRDFLEQTRVLHRGRARVGAFLCADAAGGDESARALSAAFEAERAEMEASARRPLREALAAAKGRLQAGLAGMEERLEARVSAAFVESLYPPLASGGACVADDDDPDDDATAVAAPAP